MGVLRQKCVPTYESFLNASNIGFNISYTYYLKQIDNESMLRVRIIWRKWKKKCPSRDSKYTPSAIRADALS